MSSNLTFRKPRAERDALALRLRFGDTGEAPGSADVELRATLKLPRFCVKAFYDHRVMRKMTGGGAVVWQRGTTDRNATRDGWQDSDRRRDAAALSWERAAHSFESAGDGYSDSLPLRGDTRLPWERGVPIRSETVAPHRVLDRSHRSGALSWERGVPLAGDCDIPFVFLVPLRSEPEIPWRETARAGRSWHQQFAHGVWLEKGWRIPWKEGLFAPVGESVFRPPRPPEPRPPKYGADLRFRCRMIYDGLRWWPSLPLIFGKTCGGRDYKIPILEVYFVSNDVQVVRLPGREPIGVKDIRLSIDNASWAWGMSAQIRASDFEMIEPTAGGPVEIEVTINGVQWVVLVEKYNSSREFASETIGIEGRSRAAYLADPYAPTRSFTPAAPFTARQLAEQELTRAGLITGFDLDWQLADWLVPAGAWSYQALTPMSVIQQIAESVGGYVNAHHFTKSVLVKSRYPTLPWEWGAATPDIEIPIEAVKSMSLNWNERPAYNAVYVSGERVGVTALVKRAGTAGDVLAQMVSDPLITHVDAARERGRAVLGDTGRQASVTIALPMFETLGLITPGSLLETGKTSARWRGLVRSTSVSADFSEALIVRQTLGIERHYG